MKWLRWLFWLILLLLGLLGGLYLALPYLVPKLAASVLTPFGIHASQIEITHPTLTKLEIPRVALTLDDGTSVTADSIVVSYMPQALLSGKVSGVSVGKAAVDLRLPTGTESAGESTSIEDIIADIPFKKLTVQSLRLRTDALETPAVSVPKISLTSDTPIEITLDAAERTWAALPFALKIEIPELTASGYRFTPTPVVVNATVSPTAASGSIESALIEQTVRLQSEFDFNLVDQRGVIQTTVVPIDLAGAKPLFDWLKQNTNATPALRRLRISSGRLSVDATTAIGPELSPTIEATVKIDRARGAFDDVVFSGLRINAPLSVLPKLQSRGFSSFSVDTIYAGLPISLLKGKLKLVNKSGFLPSIIQGRAISAGVLGGSISVAKADYDLRRAKQALTVRLEEIQIKEVLQVQQQQGLSGDGVLDGELPVQFSRDGVAITQGTIATREPGGTIRYDRTGVDETIAKTDPSIRLALKALSNYQFNTLTGAVNYQPNGTLNLGLSLSGKNPDFNNGQQINLNLNVEENILALLKSLQLSADLSEKLGQRLQRQN